MLYRSLLAPLAALLLAAALSAQAQTGSVGIGTTAPDASAALDIVSSSKGALLPRLTQAQVAAIARPATGLLVFVTDGVPGFYYNAGPPASPAWQPVGAGAGGPSGPGDNLGNHTATQNLDLNGNLLISTNDYYGAAVGIGVRPDGGLNIGQNTTGHSLYLGYGAGQANAGRNNLFVGYNSGAANTTGEFNQFTGSFSGVNTTTGSFNQFSGYGSGYGNTTGSFNYFSGPQSGSANTTGNTNLFVGYQSGYRNTTGSTNQFVGYSSGSSNTTGSFNQFSGFLSGYRNTTGEQNQFSGFQSGFFNTTGSSNLFVGYASGNRNTTGSSNAFVGFFSGEANGTGSFNTALGANSGPDGGSPDLTNATALGANVKLTQSNTVVLGNGAKVGIGTSYPAQALDVTDGSIKITTAGQGLIFPDGTVQTTAATGSGPAAGDNLGNHTATQNLNMQGNALVGTGASIGGIGVGIRADGGLNLAQWYGNNLLLGYQAGQSLALDFPAGAGLYNQFSGYQSGQATVTGSANLFSGYQSGYANTGTGNHFVGYQAGYSNTSGEGNQFSGYTSGYSTTTGFANVFSGPRSGFANTTGYNNQYLGFGAGSNSTTGHQNLFVGYGSGLFNDTGSNNTALGANSGPDRNSPNLTNATALGANVALTQDNTVVLGSQASVGIGTSAPEEKLHVVGTIYSSTGGFRFPDNTVQATAAVAPQLALNGQSLSIGGGNTVTLPTAAAQQLALNGRNLSISGGNAVTLPTDLDNQTLSISGSTISLTGSATSITVPSSADNLGNHTATTNLGLNGNYLSNAAGTANGLRLDNAGNATLSARLGIGTLPTAVPVEKLEIRDGSVQLTGTGPAAVGISNGTSSLNLALAANAGEYSNLAQPGDAVLRTNGKRLILAGRDGGSVLLSTGPTGSEAERLRVTADGGVGIGTAGAPDASAALEVKSTTKGVLLPRLTQAQRDAIATPAVGLTLYNTTTAHLNTWTGTAWDAGVSATEQPVQNATVTFNYTGAEQTYTVPANVTSLAVDAAGAAGGPNGGSLGLGGRVQTTLAVLPGQVLRIYVGGLGTQAPAPGIGGGGYNGGGNGTNYNYGGGGTDIRRGGNTPADRIVVAGGGGGAASVDGGVGGGLVGGLGRGTYPGQGGTQTAGGAGALGVGDGAFFQGGAGNFSGGGGGWYGGGGGGRSGSYGGGGGGSSYVSAAGSGTVHTQGFRQGNGYVTLTPGPAIPAPTLDGRNFVNVPSSADNLGNHLATQKLDLAANKLVGNGGTTGLAISSAGVISTDGQVNAGGNVNLGANQLVGNGGSTGLAVSSTGSVGIGGPAPASAALAVTSTSQGFLPPRMGPTERDAITAPAAGLTIYNTTTNKLNTWNGTSWTEALGTSEQPLQNPATTFAFTGAEQSYTVPVGVYSLGVDARGGQGGSSGAAAGGAGGRVQTTLAVTPGEVLKIYVGGAGGTAENGNVGSGAGYNGGGLGKNANGGGGTDIRRGGNTPTDRLVVAGGGGGSAGGTAGAGGSGGGLVGAVGTGEYPGQGGTQTAGGSGGKNIGPGSFFEGGSGFSSGGGGGWYGGGGGSWVSTTGGGGGGSSYVAAGSSATTHTQGYQAGPGSLTLTPGPAYATPALSGVNFVNVPGDNLGNHTATTNLNLGPNALVGNGGSTGLTIANSGTVKVNALGNGSSTRMVTAAADGTLAATALPTDAQQLSISGSTLALTNGGSVALASLGDNLGNHLATQNLSLGTNALVGSGGTTGLTVATSGNVGIGTTAAQPATQKLDVRGNLRLGTDGGQITGLGQTIEFVGPGLNTDPVGLYRINTASDASELRVVVGDASDVNDRFSVGRTSASTEGALAASTFTPTFTVRADGNVGIGTSTPQAGLHVDRPESANTTALGVLLGGGTSGNPSIELRGTTSTPYIDFVENPSLDYSTRLISQAGTLNLLYGNTAAKPANLLNVDGGIRATAFNTASDARFKANVRPLGSALASVLALRGVRYEWNALGIKHGGTAGASQVGVLAQEIEKIYPELVSTDKDGYKAVNYAQLTPVLIEALKEQQAQIEALKVRAAAAEADHASLLTLQAQVARLLGEAPTARIPK